MQLLARCRRHTVSAEPQPSLCTTKTKLVCSWHKLPSLLAMKVMHGTAVVVQYAPTEPVLDNCLSTNLRQAVMTRQPWTSAYTTGVVYTARQGWHLEHRCQYTSLTYNKADDIEPNHGCQPRHAAWGCAGVCLISSQAQLATDPASDWHCPDGPCCCALPRNVSCCSRHRQPDRRQTGIAASDYAILPQRSRSTLHNAGGTQSQRHRWCHSR